MLLNNLMAFSLKEEIVDVPELCEDAQVLVRELAGKRLMGMQNISKDSELYSVHMMIACMVDEEGNQIHTHDQAELLFDTLPPSVFTRLNKACMRVNGISTKPVAAKKKS